MGFPKFSSFLAEKKGFALNPLIKKQLFFSVLWLECSVLQSFLHLLLKSAFCIKSGHEIHGGYYMATRRYEISLQVLKNICIEFSD